MNAVPGVCRGPGRSRCGWLQCTATWNKLDTGKRGSVSQSQAQGVVTDFKAADTNNDDKLSHAEFMAACNKGLVTASAATGSSARGMTGNDAGRLAWRHAAASSHLCDVIALLLVTRSSAYPITAIA
jgi:hypothetical protein